MAELFVSSMATGVARNFDWEGPILKKILWRFLVTFFSDVKVMMPLKWRHNLWCYIDRCTKTWGRSCIRVLSL